MSKNLTIITSEDVLRDVIIQMEHQQAQVTASKGQPYADTEKANPIKMIKNSIHEITSSRELKESLLFTGIGLTAGYLTKRLYESVSTGPLKKVVGTTLMISITNLVSTNPEFVKTVAYGIVNLFRNRKAKKSHGGL